MGRHRLMILPIAHGGHWLINLLYVAPLVVALGVLGYQARKDRRAVKDGSGQAGRKPPAGHEHS